MWPGLTERQIMEKDKMDSVYPPLSWRELDRMKADDAAERAREAGPELLAELEADLPLFEELAAAMICPRDNQHSRRLARVKALIAKARG